MTTFPGSPRLPKGAIVAIDTSSPLIVSTIAFQYNPETMTRTLQAQTIGNEGGAKTEALRLQGAPVETIKLDVEIDATDQLEKANAIAIGFGIYPQLSALETLVYPKSTQVIANMLLANLGTVEIIPTEAPMTLLVWGAKRVLPVRLTDFSITEEAYDTSLNPIRAKVSLSLRVLSYNDLPWNKLGSGLFLANQIQKELMGVVGGMINPAAVTGINII
ncbi:MAG: hypothetical protein ACHBN1_14295 [Heteroscytonema crispum UTEX LB 1556]